MGWIIDSIIIWPLAVALWIPVVHAYVNNYRAMIRNPDIDEPSGQAVTGHVFGLGVLALLASVCIPVAYYWLLTGFWGTTLGKRALGTWVVTDEMAKVNLSTAFNRALVFVAGPVMIPFFFFFLDNTWLFWNGRRKCLHDLVAHTLVVKGKPVGRQPVRRRA